MAKPILIARLLLPDKVEVKDWRAELYQALIKTTQDEYHVIIVFLPVYEEPRFEVLNADCLDPIDIEKLKNVVNEKI